MGADHTLADGEAEPAPPVVAPLGRRRSVAAAIGLVEAVEDALGLPWIDARSGVVDRHHDLAFARLGAQEDARTGRGVAGRVLEQILQHLLDQDGVDAHERQLRGEIQIDLQPRHLRLEPLQRYPHDLFEGLPFPTHDQRPRGQSRHLKQIAHQAVQPDAFLVDRLEHVPPHFGGRGGVLLQEKARRAGDRSERRAEIVGHRAEQRVEQALSFHPERGRLGFVDEERALESERGLARERLEQAPPCGITHRRGRLGIGGDERDDPERASRRAQRDVEGGRAGQRVGARTGGLIVIEHPLRDAALLLAEEPRLRPGQRGQRGAPTRQQDLGLAAEDVHEVPNGDPPELV